MATKVVLADPARSCFYRIKEGSRNEYVAVGSTGRIVRWSYKDEPQQIWLLLPYDLYNGKVRYRIMTKQNGEYMAVEPRGKVLRWNYTEDGSQWFLLGNERDTWYTMQEFTRSEYVDVPSNGDLLRWGWTGGNNQRYQLEAVNEPPKPVLRTGGSKPDQIPFPPKLTGIDDIPAQTTGAVLIGETVLPSTIVDESRFYPSKIAQMEACPYYILAREQFWKRTSPAGFYYSHNSNNTVTKTFEISVGLEKTESETMEETVGMVLSGGMEVGFKKGSATIGAEVSHSLTLTQYQSVTWMGYKTVTQEYTFAQPMAFVYWALVDRFTLMRGDRSIVKQWQISRMDVHASSSYPVEPTFDGAVVQSD